MVDIGPAVVGLGLVGLVAGLEVYNRLVVASRSEVE